MPSVMHIITKLSLGGAQETVFYYYNNLDRDKFDVYLYAGNETDFQDDEVLKRLLNEPNTGIFKNLKNRMSPILDIKAVFEIYRHLKKHPVDIVHTHSAKAGILGRIGARLAGTKVIVHTVHGWSFYQCMWWLTKAVYICLERLTARFSNKLITVTSVDIQKGIEYGIGNKDSYVTIRSGIEFSRFDNIDETRIKSFKDSFGGKKIVGSIGRLSTQKNYCDFIKVAKLICDRRDDVHFVIVGDGELKAELEAQIKDLGIAQKVTLLGLRTDIEIIMRAFDVFLLTSLWEGLPRVLPEAMYCEIPVVAYGVDGIVEIIDNTRNGFYVMPGEIEKARDIVERLIDDAKFRESIIIDGKDSVKEYSAKKMLEDTQNLYIELLNDLD